MTALEISKAKPSRFVIMSDSANDSNVKANMAKRQWKIVALTSFTASVVFCLVFASILFYYHSNAGLRMISRYEWIAQPPEDNPIPLNVPVERIIIAHTNTTPCTTQANCNLIVRSIQADHVERQKMDDIAYNFLIGGNGLIYFGRGWNAEGNHTKGYNTNSICIAIVGTFDIIAPPRVQLESIHKLIVEGIRLRKISNNYRLYGQQQLISTNSPGRKLYEIIKTWSHWTANIQR